MSLAMLLCGGFAVRDVASGDGSPATVLRVAASVVAAAAAGLYMKWFVRNRRHTPNDGAPQRRARQRDATDHVGRSVNCRVACRVLVNVKAAGAFSAQWIGLLVVLPSTFVVIS